MFVLEPKKKCKILVCLSQDIGKHENYCLVLHMADLL